ncbi:hypothetical protein ORV05_13445 [Amycolatopsis cynarae]|uniref:Uncharacterized protein n=1 Tax=Amycolatopsis cynarae TaxID=2995223 RepID=A0ABY7BBE2_9PSEU|nr:hypothetical protein [Amycolatopsis sp. HUAS 11-8]WAL69690.1 hypothetical protein ORV05_13445 [Amycolatopsis sp. HUAS 11-8]
MYRCIRDRLLDDFEVEPGEELRRTRMAILAGDTGYLGFG